MTTIPAEELHNRFDEVLAAHGCGPLRARSLRTLQVNVGRLCNQACRHCHVEAGPDRDGDDENMDAGTAALVLQVLERGPFEVLDLTGGAPELNPSFRGLVAGARRLGLHVLDRCNLSVLFEPGQEDLAGFLAAQRVEVVASLPYYRRERTDSQRGRGAFDRSIEGLLRLNAVGYGLPGTGLELDLVYNPGGAYLPGPQAELEAEFRRILAADHGIRFTRLFALTNLPIRRFRDYLVRSGNAERYQRKLEAAFNPAAAAAVMCRDLLSVGPDGTLYDCDFNQMLELPVRGPRRHLRDLDAALAGREVVTGLHCFGCTAGAGSSCGGAVVG
ncbi:MAG: arsenosugar biosynthesis radical SAM protein ArsS [Planctomycetota bacterium]